MTKNNEYCAKMQYLITNINIHYILLNKHGVQLRAIVLTLTLTWNQRSRRRLGKLHHYEERRVKGGNGNLREKTKYISESVAFQERNIS